MFLRKLDTLPCAKWFIAHEKAVEVTSPTKTKFTRYEWNVGGQTGDIIEQWMDFIFHVRLKSGERELVALGAPLVMRTVGTIDVLAKRREHSITSGMEWKLAADGKGLDAAANWAVIRGWFE
jgi:hypothetical protein